MKIREEQKALADERRKLEAILASKAQAAGAGARGNAKPTRPSLATSGARVSSSARPRRLSRRPNCSPTSRSRWCCPPAALCARPKATTSTRARCHTNPEMRFQAAARGRSTQLAVFIDSTGRRLYSLPAHALPSARGQGEAAVRAARSARWCPLCRRADRRARGFVAAGHRCRIRLPRCASRKCTRAIAPARRC